MAIDLETTGLDADKDKIFMLSAYSTDYSKVWNYNTGCTTPNARPLEHLKQIAGALKERSLDFEQRNKLLFCAHNAPFDLSFLEALVGKFEYKEYYPIVCTRALGKFVNNKRTKLSLENICQVLFNEGKDPVKKYMDENNLYTVVDKFKNYHFHKVPDALMERYAAKDAALCHRIYHKFTATIDDRGRGNPGFKCNFNQSMFSVNAMSNRGVNIDSNAYYHWYRENFGPYVEDCDWFRLHTGHSFSDSNKLFQEIFMSLYPEHLNHFVVVNKKYGVSKVSYSFDADHLKEVDIELCRVILRIRKFVKLNNYFSDLINRGGSEGKLKATFDPTLAVTRRLSCYKPNLQNIPKDNNSELRKAIVAKEGHRLYAFDFKQMELRYALDAAGEHEAIKAIESGADPHADVARSAGISRDQAKTINFSILYGSGINSLAKNMGVTTNRAFSMVRNFERSRPKLMRMIDRLKKDAARQGYIYAGEHLTQRINFYNHEIKNALNYFIQCGTAEVVRKAMNKLHRDGFDIVMQVHDEIIIQMPLITEDNKDEIIETVEKIRQTMISCCKYSMDVDVSCGHSYGDLQDWSVYAS